jgi:ketosteroid isomerase-like protein
VKEIEELEHRLMRAVADRDREELCQLLGEDFTLTTGRPGAEVRSREEWLSVTMGDYVISSFEFEQLVVQHYGHCAIARSRYRQAGAMGGARRNTTYRMTDVWVRTAAGWRLEARHAQPVDGD